jgi:hypothetical protein
LSMTSEIKPAKSWLQVKWNWQIPDL